MWNLLADRLSIPFRRTFDGRFGIASHDRVPPAAVDAVKGVRLDRFDDVLHRLCIQRDHIGITIHKADVASVLRDLHRIARQQRTAAFRAC